MCLGAWLIICYRASHLTGLPGWRDEGGLIAATYLPTWGATWCIVRPYLRAPNPLYCARSRQTGMKRGSWAKRRRNISRSYVGRWPNQQGSDDASPSAGLRALAYHFSVFRTHHQPTAACYSPSLSLLSVNPDRRRHNGLGGPGRGRRYAIMLPRGRADWQCQRCLGLACSAVYAARDELHVRSWPFCTGNQPPFSWPTDTM